MTNHEYIKACVKTKASEIQELILQKAVLMNEANWLAEDFGYNDPEVQKKIRALRNEVGHLEDIIDELLQVNR